MATLVGTGYIEIVPRLVGGFGPQLEAQMLGGTKAAGAAAAGEAEAAGLAGGRRFTSGMRGGMSGMAGMMKTMMGLAAVVGIADFAKQSVDAFKEVAGGAVTLQRVMGGTITQASEWQAVGERFGISTQAMSVAMKTLSKDMVSGKGPLVELGVATKDVHGQMLPMGDVLMKVADKFKAMPDGAQKSRLAVELFGKSGLTLLPILNKGSAGIQELMDAAKKMGVVLDQSAIDKYKKMVVAQKDLHESVLGLKVAFGENLAPVLTSLFNYMATTIIPTIGKFLAFIERNKSDIGPMVGIVLGLVTAFKMLTAVMAAVDAVMAANPFVLIGVAIIALIAGVVLLWNHWNEVWTWIANHKAYAIIIALLTGPITLPIFALVAAAKFLQQNWDTIWKALQAGVQAFVNFFTKLPGEVVSGLSTAWNAIVDFFTKLPGRMLGFIQALPGLLVSAGKALLTGLWNGITTGASAVWSFFTALPGRIMGFVGFAAGLLVRVGVDIVKGLWNGITTAASAVWNFFTSLPGRIMGFIKAADTWLFDVGKKVLSGLAHGIEAGASAVLDFFSKLPGRIVGFIKAGDTWLLQVGKDIVGGLLHGIESAPGAIADFFVKLPGRIVGFIKDAASWLLQTGKDIISGLLNGIWTAIKDVGKWIYDHIFKPFIDGFKHAFGISSPATAMLELGKNIIEGILKGIVDAAGMLWDFIKSIPGKIFDLLKNIGSGLLNVGKAIVGGIADGIKGGYSAVTGAAQSMVNGIGNALGFGSGGGAVGPGSNGMTYRWGVGMGNGIVGGLKSTEGAIGAIVGSFNGAISGMAVGANNTAVKIGTSMGQIVANLSGMSARAAAETGKVVTSENSMATGVGAAVGKAVGSMKTQQDGYTTLASAAGAKLGQLVTAENQMATGVGSATGKAIGSMTSHIAGLATLATAAATRMGAIVGSENLMATGTEGATNRVNTQTVRHAALLAALANAAAIHMGAVVTDESTMATGTESATNRVNTQQIRHLALMASLAAGAAARMGEIIGSESLMATGTEGATNRVNTQQLRHIALMASLAAAAATHMGQIIGSESLMATGTEGATTRVQSAAQRHIAQMDTLQANVATRMGQIVASALNMATNTENTTGRAIGAFTRMQGSVNSLHGKDIKVTAGADVTISQHVIDLTKQLGIAFAAAEGGFLPSQATIAKPVAGRGLVQWAEPETGGEAFIPLAPQKRKRSVEIWRTTGALLGQFDTGGLLNITLPDVNNTQWLRAMPAFQSDTEGITTSLGQKIETAVGSKIGAAIGAQIEAAVLALQSGAAGAMGVADSNAVVAFAKTLIGSRYGPPYYDPSGFSCDGFVWYVFKHFGIDIGRNAELQMRAAQPVPHGQQQPGDVVGFHHSQLSQGMLPGYWYGHIGLVTGMDQMIDALGTAYGVRVDSISNIGSEGYNFGRFLKNLNPGYVAGAAMSPGATLGGAVSMTGRLTRAQITALAAGHGLPIPNFVDIAWQESGWNPNASNAGLWGIISPMIAGNLRDPNVNAANAAAIFRSFGYGAWPWYHGGPVNGNFPPANADGGIRMAAGGLVPGSGTKDTVPAMLQPNEFVMTQKATAKFLPLLESLNAESGGSSRPGSARMAATGLTGALPAGIDRSALFGAGLGSEKVAAFGAGGAGSIVGSGVGGGPYAWTYFLGQWHQNWWWAQFWRFIAYITWRNNMLRLYYSGVIPYSTLHSNPMMGVASGGFMGSNMPNDTIPAMLTPGEFVMGPDATAKYRPLLEGINRSVGGTNTPKMMAGGGLVGGEGGWSGLNFASSGTGRAASTAGVGTVQHNTVNLTLNVANGEPVQMRAAAQQVVDDALTALARRLSSGAGRN